MITIKSLLKKMINLYIDSQPNINCFLKYESEDNGSLSCDDYIYEKDNECLLCKEITEYLKKNKL